MLLRFRNFGFFTHFLVITLNPWWWIIIQRNLWIGLLVFILSFLVFQYFWQTKSKLLLTLIILITVVLVVISFREAIDESIFRNSALDIQQMNKRHEFYASGLGKLYKNRFVLTYFKDYNFPISKLQRNFFGNLDLNLYFFTSHPRERVGVEEFQKYSPIFLPFFLIGVFYSIYALLSKMLIYSVPILLLSSLFSPSYNLGPVLLFTVINLMITVGIILSWRKISSYFENKNEV